VGSQVPVAGPSCELGFGKGAAGTLQVIVAGHRSKVLWVDLVHCQGRMHTPDRHSMQIGVEFYLHRDVCIEAFRARGRNEAVFDLSTVFDSNAVFAPSTVFDSNAVFAPSAVLNAMRC
jgi:hypothetical protein